MSTGIRKEFTKDEATAAERVWLFHLTNTADGTNATGKTIAGADFIISKNGAAFGNAAGTVTELSGGWYTMAFAAADLETEGELAYVISESGCDTLRGAHRIKRWDEDVATAVPPDGGLTAAKFGADALAAISTRLDTRVKTASMTANGVSAISMLGAIDVTVEVTGTFDSGSAQIQTTEDPAAAVPVWTNRGSALTANGQVVVAGPHSAIRVNLTGVVTAAALALKFIIRKPAGL